MGAVLKSLRTNRTKPYSSILKTKCLSGFVFINLDGYSLLTLFKMKQLLFAFVFLIASASMCAQKNITINNIRPRLDENGEIIDLHDGRVIKFGNRFYWYGTSYGKTNGFVRTNHYRCYSSTDLTNWKKEGKILVDQPSGIYYRPHVIYNERTKKYVLWYNWYPKLWDGKYGVAIADTPVGPFEIVNKDVQVAHSKLGIGDFGLFVDDDQTAYIAYNTINGHKNSVERLSDDYLSSTLINGGFIALNCEAGAIFKHNAKYYMLTDYTCCFCTQGSGARVYVSDNPLSGYELQNNINRYPGIYAPGLIDGVMKPNLYTTLERGKEDNTFPSIEVEMYETPINQLKIYFFTGNRGGMCGDTLAERVHDKIINPEFTFKTKKSNRWVDVVASQKVKTSSVFNVLTFSFDQVIADGIRIIADSTFPYDKIFIAEVQLYHNDKRVTGIENETMAFVNNNVHAPIIPAQQTHVMPLNTTEGIKYIWMGDLWGSASDNVKGHDYQYWGAPLQIDENGNIKRMDWVDEWSVTLTD